MHFFVQNTTIRIGYFTTQMGVIFFGPNIFIEVTTAPDKFQKMRKFHAPKKKIFFTNVPFGILKAAKSSIFSHVISSPNPLLNPLESLQLGQQLICSNLLHSGQQFRLTGATPAFC